MPVCLMIVNYFDQHEAGSSTKLQSVCNTTIVVDTQTVRVVINTTGVAFFIFCVVCVRSPAKDGTILAQNALLPTTACVQLLPC